MKVMSDRKRSKGKLRTAWKTIMKVDYKNKLVHDDYKIKD